MSHQFKPIDLAITLIDNESYLAGTQVELLKAVPAGTEYTDFVLDQDGWEVRFSDDTEGVYAEALLMPLCTEAKRDGVMSREVHP